MNLIRIVKLHQINGKFAAATPVEQAIIDMFSDTVSVKKFTNGEYYLDKHGKVILSFSENYSQVVYWKTSTFRSIGINHNDVTNAMYKFFNEYFNLSDLEIY